VAAAILVVALAPTGWSQTAYSPPVEGPVVRRFVAPSSPWGPGHRGVDFAVRPDEPVRAMASGVVGFAGTVVGTLWVSVDHPDGLRTTYGPFANIAVRQGDRLSAGQTLGTVDAVGAHGVAGLLHVGARRVDTYLDPMTLLQRAGLVPTLVGPAEVGVRRGDRTAGRLTLVPGTPPSPNHLIVLAGYGSRTGEPPLPPSRLGYGPDDASQFSYATDEQGRPLAYDSEQTWQRVHDSALALQAQLRRRWADHPGQAVDLVGHSLGGLVAVYYLLVLHDPTDPTLPPIGRVATIASPLSGTEAAAAVGFARQDPVLRILVGLLDRANDRMSADAPVMKDLVPGSDVTTAIRDAWEHAVEKPFEGPLATGTTVLTLGALLDPVVPAHNTDLGDAEHRMVFDSHGGAPTDAYALATLEAYLAGQPLPGADVAATIADVLSPLSYVVGLLELAAAQGLG
jgi:hypothetical protein